MLNGNFKKGDTLIEVLFASAVFSLIATGGLAIMNRGTTTIQRSYEMTMVRQEIDAQASTLRFLNASYVAAFSPGASASAYTGAARQWYDLDNYITNNGSSISNTQYNVCPDDSSGIGSGRFVLNTRTAELVSSLVKFKKPDVYSAIRYAADNSVSSIDGIWIEAQKYTTSEASSLFYDFHIKTCWYGPGEVAPITLDTVVRLYAPK